MLSLLISRGIGVFKWTPLWVVTDYVGVVASVIYLIFGETLMFRFYSFIWPLTLCLLAKPGAQFLFQLYFGFFTKFRIPELVYSLVPLVTIAIIWLCYLNKKHHLSFFLFSLLSVLVTSVIVLADAYLGVGPKLTRLSLLLYTIAIMVSSSGLVWLVVGVWNNGQIKKQQNNEDNQIRESIGTILANQENTVTLKFFNLEEYILDRKKDVYELLRELDSFLDSSGINYGSHKQLTMIVKFKTIVKFRTTKVVFTFINQSAQLILECLRVTQVLPKIDGHDNMGFDFDIEYLPVMKQAIKYGIQNYLVSCNSNQCKTCSCQMVS